jgi:hypothetical protein
MDVVNRSPETSRCPVGSAVLPQGNMIVGFTDFDVDVIDGGRLMRVMEGNACGDAATRVFMVLGSST